MDTRTASQEPRGRHASYLFPVLTLTRRYWWYVLRIGYHSCTITTTTPTRGPGDLPQRLDHQPLPSDDQPEPR